MAVSTGTKTQNLITSLASTLTRVANSMQDVQNGQDEIPTMEKPKKSFYVYRIVFIPNEYSEHELVMALKEKKASHTNNLIKVTLDPQSHSLALHPKSITFFTFFPSELKLTTSTLIVLLSCLTIS